MKFEEFWDTYIKGVQPLDHKVALSLFSQSIDDKIAEEYDVIDTLLVMHSHYKRERLYSELYEFTEVLKTHNKSLFDRSFPYFYEDLITYYCYQEQEEMVNTLADTFMKAPMQDYDFMYKTFRKVLFYNYSILAEKWVDAVYEEVAHTSNLLSGAEVELAFVKYDLQVGKIYHQYCDDGTFNWTEFKEKVASVGIQPKKEDYLVFIESALRDQLEDAKNAFIRIFPDDRKKSIDYLQKAFMKYMEGKGVSFAVSGEIWNFMYEHWESFEKEGEEPPPSDAYFLLQPKAFYDFIGRKSGMIMDYRFQSAAILWGSVYVYDFLYKIDLLTPEQYEQHREMLKRMQRLFRKETSKVFWEYSFIHRWGLPDSKSEAEIAEEETAIARAFELKSSEVSGQGQKSDPELLTLKEEFYEPRKTWSEKMFGESSSPIKAPEKISRNTKVTVRYTSGSIKRNIKYKLVMKDIRAGKCEIIS